jgi:hypothetical protein
MATPKRTTPERGSGSRFARLADNLAVMEMTRPGAPSLPHRVLWRYQGEGKKGVLWPIVFVGFDEMRDVQPEFAEFLA